MLQFSTTCLKAASSANINDHHLLFIYKLPIVTLKYFAWGQISQPGIIKLITPAGRNFINIKYY